ncbi:hypothetical protein LTR66_008155 [Elasticomyces elasticus]|nr:hypothetical protein LTR66_008155 [Elasticomyces elasticus]KAK4986707.1 hypothetical protein LTR28_001965 [Elasticomyces elasticus]KAK4987477.1 hypothetical protein LTR50_004609 [Elasticomyces elasticus]
MAEEASRSDVVFNARETKLLVSMMKHMQADPSVDYDAVASELGYKDGSIVKTRWNQIKRKKINASSGSPSGGVAKTTKKTTTKSPKDKKAEVKGDDNGSPKPKKRGRKPKSEVKVEGPDVDSGSADGGDTAVKEEVAADEEVAAVEDVAEDEDVAAEEDDVAKTTE